MNTFEFSLIRHGRTSDGQTTAPLVDQIVQQIGRAMHEGRLRPGDRLPSIRRLATTLKVSPFTVSDAYQRASAQGLVNSRPGSGYSVADWRGETVPRPWAVPALNAAWLLSDVFADHSVPTKAGCGWIPGEWINSAGLQHALRVLSRAPGARMGGYGHPYGMGRLREQIAARLRSTGLPVDSNRILMTQGVTQALDIVVRTLFRPGDTVLVEDPGYCNLLQILQLAGLKVIGVAKTHDGVDLAQLDALAHQHQPKAVFVNTVLQNPSGVSFSKSCAVSLIEVAKAHDMWIIEDDIYRELAQADLPCLAALDGLQRVIYLSGFSKTISPMLRVGFLSAHESLLQSFARTKMAVGLTSSEVSERIVSNVLLEGHHEQHVSALKAQLHQAHQLVAGHFKEIGIPMFVKPGAGLFLWADLPIAPSRANDIAAQALEHGIWLAPGSYFRPLDQPSSWFRFNVANADSESLWRFIGQLAGKASL